MLRDHTPTTLQKLKLQCWCCINSTILASEEWLEYGYTTAFDFHLLAAYSRTVNFTARWVCIAILVPTTTPSEACNGVSLLVLICQKSVCDSLVRLTLTSHVERGEGGVVTG